MESCVLLMWINKASFCISIVTFVNRLLEVGVFLVFIYFLCMHHVKGLVVMNDCLMCGNKNLAYREFKKHPWCCHNNRLINSWRCEKCGYICSNISIVWFTFNGNVEDVTILLQENLLPAFTVCWNIQRATQN